MISTQKLKTIFVLARLKEDIVTYREQLRNTNTMNETHIKFFDEIDNSVCRLYDRMDIEEWI